MVTYNARDKFLLAKSTKKVFRRVNFINLKTSGGYIAKSKTQGVCLQLSQTLGGDYVIWSLFNSKLVTILEGCEHGLDSNCHEFC